MSRDRVTMTRAEAVRRRREQETMQRTQQTQQRAMNPQSASRPVVSRSSSFTTPTQALRRRFDTGPSYTTSRARAEAPAFNLPSLVYGPRLISFLVAAACMALLYTMFNSDPFLVRDVAVQGNVRIPASEIAMILGVKNQPSILINPAQIEYNVASSYPEVSEVVVEAGFPASLTVIIKERQPVVAWMQDNRLAWVDAQGYAFPPRGELAGLVSVAAAGAPPAIVGEESAQRFGARPLLTPEMTSAILALAPSIPEGASLVYDPKYGLGWADPRGWQVYFGKDNANMPMKMQVYQSMVQDLLQQEIQPTLISVEYPNAPFYRLAQ